MRSGKLFILGSSSKSRVELLDRIIVRPDIVISPSIDEMPLKKEKPRQLCQRLAIEKNKKILTDLLENLHIITEDLNYQNLIFNKKFCILTADTVAVKGARILEKTDDKNEIRRYLNLISGSNHRVYTAMCIFDAEKDRMITKISENRVKMKKLTKEEIEFYISTQEGEGCAGGYAISKYAGRFVEKIIGNPSSISGLDLRIVYNLLTSCGYKMI